MCCWVLEDVTWLASVDSDEEELDLDNAAAVERFSGSSSWPAVVLLGLEATEDAMAHRDQFFALSYVVVTFTRLSVNA